jgi:hypothetical protein
MLHSTRDFQPGLAKQLREQADQIIEVIELPSISRPLIEELDTDTEEEEEEEEEEVFRCLVFWQGRNTE